MVVRCGSLCGCCCFGGGGNGWGCRIKTSHKREKANKKLIGVKM